jgi:hypothetical protein
MAGEAREIEQLHLAGVQCGQTIPIAINVRVSLFNQTRLKKQIKPSSVRTSRASSENATSEAGWLVEIAG